MHTRAMGRVGILLGILLLFGVGGALVAQDRRAWTTAIMAPAPIMDLPRYVLMDNPHVLPREGGSYAALRFTTTDRAWRVLAFYRTLATTRGWMLTVTSSDTLSFQRPLPALPPGDRGANRGACITVMTADQGHTTMVTVRAVACTWSPQSRG